MSTRSWIAKEEKDGNVKGVFCHWDGYPAHHGAILHYKYADESQVNYLIGLGNLDSLGSIQSLNDLSEGARAWHRDGEEDWEDCKPMEWECLDDCILDAIKDPHINFLYVYKRTELHGCDIWSWYCYDLFHLRKIIPNLCVSL